MPYRGPGPAVIGEAEYRRVMEEEERTAGGTVGSALLGPAVEVKTPDPIFEPPHPDPVEEPVAEEAFTRLHVMKALRKIADCDDPETLARWEAEEQARQGSGPRPTVMAAFEAKRG